VLFFPLYWFFSAVEDSKKKSKEDEGQKTLANKIGNIGFRSGNVKHAALVRQSSVKKMLVANKKKVIDLLDSPEKDKVAESHQLMLPPNSKGDGFKVVPPSKIAIEKKKYGKLKKNMRELISMFVNSTRDRLAAQLINDVSKGKVVEESASAVFVLAAKLNGVLQTEQVEELLSLAGFDVSSAEEK
jgi:hypothetical protein